MNTDLLFLTHNRKAFTEASLNALQANTNWGLVDKFIAYDEESTDGTLELVKERLSEISEVVPVELRQGRWNGPAGVMRDYVQHSDSDVFAKIDNDVITPPGWLDDSHTVMEQNPELDLLGLEPPVSRTGEPNQHRICRYDATLEEEHAPGPLRYVAVCCIGGVGLMRTERFRQHNNLIPTGIYSGFSKWQQEHHVRAGWIAPALRLFLVDRLPFNPWRSLAQHYILKGWQRTFNAYLGDEADRLWGWWDDRRFRKLHERSRQQPVLFPQAAGRKHLLAANPVGVGVACQRSTPTGERSSLLKLAGLPFRFLNRWRNHS
jgi:glycosyltransferase involved in cell wall biosynthesis